MFEWLDTGLGTIGALGVFITLVAWLNSRETNKILAKQDEYLKGMRESTDNQLKETRESTTSQLKEMRESTTTTIATMDKNFMETMRTMQASLERMHTHFQESMQQMDANAGTRHREVIDKLDNRR